MLHTVVRNRYAALALATLALAACGGGSDLIEITIVPGAEMKQLIATTARAVEIKVSGADEAKQSYTQRQDGTALFADGAERVTYAPKADAQGSLRVDVVVRDKSKAPIGVGYAEVPLLRGAGAIVRVTIDSPGPCDNEVKDVDEGGVDCGGSCDRKCDLGGTCTTNADCVDGGCIRGQCAPAGCGNGVTDGDETGLDCGGSCPGCLTGEDCGDATDCKSGYCSAEKVCEACTDAAQCADGSECIEGECKAPGMNTRTCTILNGTGEQEFMGNTWGPCKAVSCDAGHHLSNGACESDSRTCVVSGGSGVQTWNGSGWGTCMPTGCQVGQHLENGACTSDTKACTVTNGIGTQTWNGSSYGICIPTMCNSGYHVETANCVENTKACSVANGMGTQTWNGSGYGTCMATSCNGGYHVEGSGCANNTRGCSIANGTGSQTWNGSGYGTCAPTMCNGGYHIETGSCMPDTKSCTITNGTGSQTWNGSSYGTCMIVSCNSGYHIEGGSCMSNSKSCAITNGTGSQTWNGTGYGTCMVVSCNTGYVPNPGNTACVSDDPTLTSVAPSNGTAWACGCQTYNLVGTNLVAGSTSYTVTAPNNNAFTSSLTVTSPTTATFTHCTTQAPWSDAGTFSVRVTVSGAGNSNAVTFSVVKSDPFMISTSPTTIPVGSTTPYCPVMNFRRYQGACQGALYGFYDAASGGTLLTPEGLPTTIGAPYPELANAANPAGCIDVSLVAAGTYWIALRNPDGGETTTRRPVTIQ